MVEARDTAAAGIADRLKAFVDAPVQFRARYARGEERLPDGTHVLRFASGKFPPEWRAGETQRVRAAAEAFVRHFCLREGADHYETLCATRDAGPDDIKERYHLLMALLHPDRVDARGNWPEACAQRVNAAYAVLGDEAARRAYDLTLTPQPASRPHQPRSSRRPRSSDTRFAKALLAVSIAMAGFVVVLLMLHEDDWSDRTLMDSAIAALRSRPARVADRPRFVGAALEPARANDAPAADAPPADSSLFAFMKPLMARLRSEEPVAWAPPPTIVAVRESPPSTVAERPRSPAEPAPPRSEPSVPVRVAQVGTAPLAPATAPAPAKPAVPVKAAAAPRPTNEDIERLVVALVGYYEAGDADHLMGLLDTRQAGFWRSAQIRQSYEDFFRATRGRRLRVETLAWNTQPGTASAKGEATVVAEYFDQNAPVERRVPVELDVAMRDGRALITRLALFPLSP